MPIKPSLKSVKEHSCNRFRDVARRIKGNSAKSIAFFLFFFFIFYYLGCCEVITIWNDTVLVAMCIDTLV